MTTKQFEISQTFTIFTGESRHISSIILLRITLRKWRNYGMLIMLFQNLFMIHDI